MAKQALISMCMMLVLLSCKKDNRMDCFKSTGADVTEQRAPGRFSSIKLYDKINLTIVQGSDYKVEVTAGEHLINNIRTKIEGNVLRIYNSNTCNFVRGYKRQVSITVTVPHLRRVENWGVGTIHFPHFVQDTLDIKAESSGDIYLSGSFTEVSTISSGNGDIYLDGDSRRLFVFTNGTNFFRGSNMLVTDVIFVETQSIGDCYVNASRVQRLGYRIWDKGNIYYTGNPPEINDASEKKADGKLIRQE